MRITRRQLRRLIAEIYTASPEGVISGEEEDRSPAIRVDDRPFGTAPKRSHVSPEVQDLLDLDDPEYTKQAYELSDTLQGYPEGSTQAAIDDERYATTMSKIAGSPLADIVSELPKGFRLVGLESGNYGGTGHKYTEVKLHSDAGGLEINVSLEDISASRGPSIQINAFVKDQTDGYWDFYNSIYIDDAFKNVDEVQHELSKIAGELRHNFPRL